MSGEIRKRRLPKCFLVTIDMKVRDNVDGTVWVRKGSMCLEQDNGSNQGEYLWVKVLDIKAILKLEKKFLLEVTSDLGRLLEPVDPDERMKLIDNPGMLTQLATLPEGAPLWVQMGQQDELAEALLRYIGPVSASSTAVYFGVQLKGSAKGRGMSDGSYNGRQLFLCPENCALFVPVSRVRQRQWSRSNRNGSEVPPDPNEDRIRRHVSRRSHPHGNTHHSNGHAIQSSHHGNGHQEKPHKRFSLHQSQHSHKLSAQSILSRSTDPPIYSQTHVKGSSSSPFHVGQRVQVPINDTVRSGEVRWCGLLPGRSSSGTYVGVQLDDPAGQWNGYFNNYKLCTFSSPEYGALLPVKQVSAVSESKLNRLTASTQAFKSMLKNALPPVPKLSTSPTSAPPPPIISAPVPASTPAPAPVPVLRAALMPPNKTKPPPLPPPKPAHKPLPVVPPPKPNNLTNHTDTDQSAGNGIQSLSLSQDGPEEAGDSVEDGTQDSGHGRGLELGSMVEVNDPPVYGVIRWIGRISGVPEAVAGIELEEQELSAGTDGSYLGERYFYCPPSKGLFIKLRKCRRDSRFPEPETPINQVERCNSIAFADWGSERVEDHTPPLEGDEARELYQGWKRGIQGHLNSCYLDASLFSLFSCCSSADWVLFWPIDAEKDQSSSQAQDLLRCEIVNPLRRFGYVCASKTMALRRLLEAANSDTSFTNEEKDPEEFINKLFQLLKVEPLLKIRSMSQKPQECHMYQLFPPSLPSSPSSLPHGAPHSPIPLLSPAPGRMRVSSVQSLLESSFFHSGLKFVEAPSCLLLLMPRFGKDFKMYDAILPSLNIDITDLLDDTLRQCSICEAVAEWECLQCYDDPDITPGHLKQYCPTCNTQVHSHKKRLSHGPVQIGVPQESYSGPLHCTRQRMTLFAVTCIETSHYVSFVKHGPAPNDWLFFDSMADREGGENGFNVPRVKACPEVGRYLSLSEDDLGRVDPSSLKESTRRLLCDAHMCLYHSPELSLYK